MTSASYHTCTCIESCGLQEGCQTIPYNINLKTFRSHTHCACIPMQVAQVVMTGKWDDEDVTEVLQLGMGACSQIDAYMRQSLREAMSADSTQ